jgi:hypothetical protein
LIPWLLGIEAIFVATWVAIARLRMDHGDELQQRQLVKSIAHWRLEFALSPILMRQTSGPGGSCTTSHRPTPLRS